MTDHAHSVLRQTSSFGDENANSYFFIFLHGIYFLLLPLLYSRNVVLKSNLEDKKFSSFNCRRNE